MLTATIHNPQQYYAVAKEWHHQLVVPSSQSGELLELSIRKLRNSKSRLQEKKYHAMLGDIAAHCRLHTKELDAESWKRLLIDAFHHETANDPQFAAEWRAFGKIELLPALNHPGFVMVGEQSRRFSMVLGSGFIEFLFAFGADQGVTWSDPKLDPHGATASPARPNIRRIR